MRSWIAVMAVVTIIGLSGCSQTPTPASPSGEPSVVVNESVNDSASAAPPVQQEELTEAEAEAEAVAVAVTPGRQAGNAVAPSGDEVDEEAVTDESLDAEEAAMTAEAEAEAEQRINESNYLRALADLQRQIGADGGA